MVELMSGHLIRLIVNSDFRRVFKALFNRFGNVYGDAHIKENGNHLGIIVGEEFFFRVGSYVALIILLEEIGESQVKVDIISYAGGEGLLGISWGAHNKYSGNVVHFLKRRGFTFIKQAEIDYLDSSKLPSDVKEKLVRVMS